MGFVQRVQRAHVTHLWQPVLLMDDNVGLRASQYEAKEREPRAGELSSVGRSTRVG